MDKLGPLFIPPHEPDRMGPAIAILAGVVIAAGLVALVRGRLPDALSYSGLLLLPLFGYALGNLNLLEESKRVEFCGSCHEPMAPLVEAMRADMPFLSSKHYRSGAVPHDSACYRCHGGYGLWGDAKAKFAGIRHMIHTVTGNYEYPLKKVGTFDISSCLDCHAQAAPFQSQKAHQDPNLQKMLLTGQIGCVGLCHPAPHPPQALEGPAAWQASEQPSK